jgi:hypothetical protein
MHVLCKVMKFSSHATAGSVVFFLVLALSARAGQPVKVTVDCNKTIVVSKTTPTMLFVAHPLLRKGRPLHSTAMEQIKDLGANYVRYPAWVTYPRLGVAELKPPTKGKTFWDFSLIDPDLTAFFKATEGRDPIIDFCLIPNWMFKTNKPASYPEDPDELTFDYEHGTKLVDPTGKQLGDYYARFVSWYTKGGFTDENGIYHQSGYHYQLPWWEVLNEPDIEHKTTPEQYTRRYDAIVSAIHKVSPSTKFVGMALAFPFAEPKFFEYFLNPKNHRPGIPLNMISYHFYAVPAPIETIKDWQYTLFDQADGFLNTVRYIVSIRRRLSPKTRVNVDELGVILPTDTPLINSIISGHPSRKAAIAATAIPPAYWNLCGAYFAYLYVQLAKLGIDAVTASQYIGYPNSPTAATGYDVFASIPLVDWKTGKPNARFRVLQLLVGNFGPGDQLVPTEASLPPESLPEMNVMAQAFCTSKGKRLLLINKRDFPVEVDLRSLGRIKNVTVVDVKTGSGPPRAFQPRRNILHLEPFAVAVVTDGPDGH